MVLQTFCMHAVSVRTKLLQQIDLLQDLHDNIQLPDLLQDLHDNIQLAANGTSLSKHPTSRRTTRGRPIHLPNLGLEQGRHVRSCKLRNFFPTSVAHLQSLANVLGPRTHNKSVCDPACGPTRRIADLLRLLSPSRIYCFDVNPGEPGLRSSDLLDTKWCLQNLTSFYAIVTSLPYRGNGKTIMFQNLIRLLHERGSSNQCVAIKMLSSYDACRGDGRVTLLQQVSIEIKLSPTVYPGYSKPFPWVESWFVFLRNHTGMRLVYYS
jgi:hypothetical protein